MTRKGFYVFFTLMMFLSVSADLQARPKFIFLFIGDGMGIPQITAAGEFVKEDLVNMKFPVKGLTSTRANDRFITGSAAAATAMSCGRKTNIGVVGMTPDLKPLKTIAEMAKAKGMKVGIVSSVSIDHATPAAFYAHVPSRGHYYDIDIALGDSGFDYFAGGTLKDPENKKKNAREYKGNAFKYIKKQGYKIAENRSSFLSLSRKDGKVVAINPWIQDSGAMPYDMDRKETGISLAEFTEKGIELLSNKKGFFMMVEGGKIDWACHANDGAAAIKDTLAFNDAVKKAYAFYRKYPKDTIIVVTGDHECGGMTLGFAGTKYASNYEILKNQKISFQKFDGFMKKLGSQGKKFDFKDIKPYITEYFGLKFNGGKDDPMVLKNYELESMIQAFYRERKKGVDSKEDYILYGDYNPLTVTITHILNQKAGIGWTSYKHTALPVITSSIGKGSELFQGYYENTAIALNIMKAMGMKTKSVYASR